MIQGSRWGASTWLTSRRMVHDILTGAFLASTTALQVTIDAAARLAILPRMQPSGSKLRTLLILAASTVSASETPASAIVLPEPPPTMYQPAAPTRAKAIAGDAGQLQRCLHACDAGGRTLTNFCNSIPDPKIARACHAVELGSEVACKGFCYCYWGT